MAATVKIIKKEKRTLVEQVYVPEIAKGLAFAMGRFFTNTFSSSKPDASGGVKKQIATIRYPEQTVTYPERFRGIHRLTHRTDGSPRCVACLCCSTACPAQCIYIEPEEYPEDDPRYGYERYPVVFTIDELRCIYCGYCVEACPCDAIRMDTGMHMPPSTKRDHFLYDKDKLMSFTGADGTQLSENPRHEKGDPTHPGITREQGH